LNKEVEIRIEKSGFTLTEIMVATALGAIFVFMSGDIIIKSLKLEKEINLRKSAADLAFELRITVESDKLQDSLPEIKDCFSYNLAGNKDCTPTLRVNNAWQFKEFKLKLDRVTDYEDEMMVFDINGSAPSKSQKEKVFKVSTKYGVFCDKFATSCDRAHSIYLLYEIKRYNMKQKRKNQELIINGWIPKIFPLVDKDFKAAFPSCEDQYGTKTNEFNYPYFINSYIPNGIALGINKPVCIADKLVGDQGPAGLDGPVYRDILGETLNKWW